MSAMAAERSGLRERKKKAARLAISQIATDMFIERGFDKVTVAEVAAAADVSEATIFNYFATKEDLFFDREAEIVETHARFVHDRRPNESIVQGLHRAIREILATLLPALFDHDTVRFLATVDASPALRARARLTMEKSEATLADAIAEDTHAKKNDPTPRAIAAMVTGIERVLLEQMRGHLLRGESASRSKRALVDTCDRSFHLLQSGVASYGKRRR